jgi:hypothetical protein
MHAGRCGAGWRNGQPAADGFLEWLDFEAINIKVYQYFEELRWSRKRRFYGLHKRTLSK